MAWNKKLAEQGAFPPVGGPMKFNHEDMYFYRPPWVHALSDCHPVNLFFHLHDNNMTFTMGRPKTDSHKCKCKMCSTQPNVPTPTVPIV